MSHERGLSQSLKYQAEKYLASRGIINKSDIFIEGIAIDYPYSRIRYASYDAQISEGEWKSYQAMEEMFKPELFPLRWIPFVKEVDKERKANGCDSPINLVDGLFFLIEDFPRAQSFGLAKFPRFNSGEIDFHDSALITKMIDIVLENDELKEEFMKALARLIPDVSGCWIDNERVEKVLRKAGITEGVFLDLGCGTGRGTEDWSKKLCLFTLGLERQYHPQWYDPHWKEGCKTYRNLGFVLGDFAMGVPLKDECVNAAILQFVAQHVTQSGLEKGLREALRVLRKDGYLFVGPQHTKDYIGWRIFKKEIGDDQEYCFKEYKYYDICPEEKRKPWRHK